jgi:hypothetical protein
MKTILLTTALSILYAPAYACGNGECDPHPDEPGIETPEKPAEPDPQPEPEQPEPEKPQPEKPAPEPSQPEQHAERAERDLHDERVTQPRYRLAAISDQTYVPSEKWKPMPKACERTWFTLRYSIPAGMTKADARQRCVEWLDGSHSGAAQSN